MVRGPASYPEGHNFSPSFPLELFLPSVSVLSLPKAKSAQPVFTLHLYQGQGSQIDQEIEQLLYHKKVIPITFHSGN